MNKTEKVLALIGLQSSGVCVCVCAHRFPRNFMLKKLLFLPRDLSNKEELGESEMVFKAGARGTLMTYILVSNGDK